MANNAFERASGLVAAPSAQWNVRVGGAEWHRNGIAVDRPTRS